MTEVVVRVRGVNYVMLYRVNVGRQKVLPQDWDRRGLVRAYAYLRHVHLTLSPIATSPFKCA